jgi:hypothetical protein
MTSTPRFPLIDNLRRYGGNFAAKLADAMAAADPESCAILVQAFPKLVDKYANMDPVTTENVICNEIDNVGLQLEPVDARVRALESCVTQITAVRQPLRKRLNQLESRLYVIQNGLSKERIHFSVPGANSGIWFGDIDRFGRHLRSIPLAERKPFAEWNGRVYALIFSDGDPENVSPCFIPTPVCISELED